MRSLLYTIVLILLLLAQNLRAIHLGVSEDGKPLPWSGQMEHPLDQVVNDACPDTPFLMNLGPTGIRAIIEPDAPKTLKVKFVFQDAKSPGKGLIKAGDHIIGVNGKEFKNPHGFHRKQDGSRGWQGPPYELALAIEDCQGTDGKLNLLVLQGGSKGSKTTVTVQLEPKGRFASTWPWNCPRSDKLLKDLLDFMLEDGNINKMKRHHYIQALLAVWASGDKRAMPLVKAKAESLMKSRPDFKSNGMGQTWMAGYNGILLGEYYNVTKDKGVKAAAEVFAPFYEYAQFSDGAYGHRSAISFINSDTKPYASMAAAGGICMLAQSLFRANGLAYSEVAYEKTHQGHLRSAGSNSGGGIAYGFAGEKAAEKPTDHAVLKLADPSRVKEPAPRPWWPELGGKDMLIEGGIKSIGKYTVEWPTSSDPRWRNGCIDWLEKEADKVTLKWSGNGKVVAWRHLPEIVIKEPTSPYNTTPNGAGHQAGSAPGTLAHFISNKGNKSWEYLGKHMATGCALSPKMLWDGHADAVIHSFFGALAAARADEKDFRTWLDYTKTWIILSETHDGQGLVDQPFGCQRNSTCSIARGRTAYTHVAIAILSIPKRQLLITGADYAQPAAPTSSSASSSSSSSSSSSGSRSSFGTKNTSFASGGGAGAGPASLRMVKTQPETRAARTLSEERLKFLNKSLLSALGKLSDGNELKAVPLQISITRPQVYLKKASDDGTLTFQVVGGSQTANVQWSSLKDADRATLALLVATLKTDSSDAQALAGIYLESVGRVTDADTFYAKASEESRRKFEKLFD